MRNNSDAKIREQVNALGLPCIETLNREIARQERLRAYRRLALGLLAGLVVAAAVIVLITNLWVAVLRIDGSSMTPLLKMDEIVLAVRTGSPEKNEIIALNHNNKLHIKRVVALAGDRVDIGEDGVVSVNGNALSEPYVSEPSFGSCDIELPFQVPPGAVFVLSDNRADSIDSRDSRFGVVEREQVIGKVIFRMWPLPRLGSIA
ncbi:MAG: signal peptidase I [Oscillospiraceae bacterium]|nr:signal peptidase I [Oscillospiraceae bacterium]